MIDVLVMRDDGALWCVLEHHRDEGSFRLRLIDSK
jgi:hypothetical protein